ncbi:MAG: hypothetical protein L3J03_10215, partial [Desulfobacterales bacterium]|nr:hypothetical protein [Desulfobacterales bacterium]
SPLRRSEFLLDSLFMNSRPFSMERPLVEEDPFPDRRGFTECLLRDGRVSRCNLLISFCGI